MDYSRHLLFVASVLLAAGASGTEIEISEPVENIPGSGLAELSAAPLYNLQALHPLVTAGPLFLSPTLTPLLPQFAETLPAKIRRGREQAGASLRTISAAATGTIQARQTSGTGFDTPLTEELVHKIARYPEQHQTMQLFVKGTNQNVRVITGLYRDRPVLRLNIQGTDHAAKFHEDPHVAHSELTVLRDVTRSYDQDRIAEKLPHFGIQRASSLQLHFTNREGVQVPVIVSAWITGHPLSAILDDGSPSLNPHEVRGLYERLHDLERSDFWRGMEWLELTGFALVDLQPYNVMVSPEGRFTVFDLETAVRKPVDPGDAWYHTRFNRAARIWKRKLHQWRDQLKARLAALRK